MTDVPLLCILRGGCVGSFCFLLGVCSLPAVGPSKDENKSIPPDLFYESKLVSEEENAIVIWKRAADAETAPSDQVKSAITYAWKPGGTPTEESQPAVRHWLQENRQALQLME